MQPETHETTDSSSSCDGDMDTAIVEVKEEIENIRLQREQKRLEHEQKQETRYARLSLAKYHIETLLWKHRFPVFPYYHAVANKDENDIPYIVRNQALLCSVMHHTKAVKRHGRRIERQNGKTERSLKRLRGKITNSKVQTEKEMLNAMLAVNSDLQAIRDKSEQILREQRAQILALRRALGVVEDKEEESTLTETSSQTLSEGEVSSDTEGVSSGRSRVAKIGEVVSCWFGHGNVGSSDSSSDMSCLTTPMLTIPLRSPRSARKSLEPRYVASASA